jgi:hypothetical protein
MRPRNFFVRPKLDSEFKEKSVFWPIFLRFLIDCGPNYQKKLIHGLKTDLGWTPLIYTMKLLVTFHFSGTMLPRLCQPRLCKFLLKNFPMRFGYVNFFVYIFSIISSLHRENKKFYTKNMYVCVSCVSLISIFDYFNFGYANTKNLT